MNAFQILVGISIILSVVSLIKPAYPLMPVAVILLGAALLLGK